jgi:hypothetical protein
VRARIEDLADSDRDIDTNIVINQTSASNRIKSNESFSLPIPPYSLSIPISRQQTDQNSPRRRRLLSVRGPDSDADDTRVADLAKRRSKAAGYGAGVGTTSRQSFSAGGEIVGVSLVAGAGDCVGG